MTHNEGLLVVAPLPYPPSFAAIKFHDHVPNRDPNVNPIKIHRQLQHVYMILAQGTFYHTSIIHPPVTRVTQGYYVMQRIGSEGYCEQPIYGGVVVPKMVFSSTKPVNLALVQSVKDSAYAEG
ncbi:hypothetical protein RJT34_07116 [Clitoria ternatea]|uniref:Uncharacterized protein n=1 Tax=Clitoria ternatea TaxID=43366 RepID=A0AAN9K4Y9_CLITE